ncbi:hypothetical protein H310_08017 [Aphanomyces invadans]|uniref:RING-type E3 ubiquitin transferase n=1 Tax=Aphanomyces invadans TaxID=157072 RepID=A0A024TZ56_9STRA|nr:hypothetical protein H310_08017 [Aphanomyces invadans]ETV99279.1 hypothetical protein H310_08017 [Aphanomyces invadans]|eukprot:XP_008871835.1 hypothetical protein H310_08017 [Aphanomyces invadans]
MGQTCSCLDHRFSGSRRHSGQPDYVSSPSEPPHESRGLLKDHSVVDVEDTDDDVIPISRRSPGEDSVVKRPSRVAETASYSYTATSYFEDASPQSSYTAKTPAARSSTPVVITSIDAYMPLAAPSANVEVADGVELECVMCLDTFDAGNPRIRTLCNCGMNRTNFHLSCLLEWTNRDSTCPVCRENLFFEENIGLE